MRTRHPFNREAHKAAHAEEEDIASGIRSVTLVVAAADSAEASKAHADYVCLGSADQSTINQALAALPSEGGQIRLMEGNYYFSATCEVTTQFITISGQATSSTFVRRNSGTAPLFTLTSSPTNIRDLAISGGDAAGNGITVDGESNCIFSRLTFQDFPSGAVGLSLQNNCQETIVSECFFNMLGTGLSCSGAENLIEGNIFDALEAGIYFSGGYSDRHMVVGNAFGISSSVTVSITQDPANPVSQITIAGNHFIAHVRAIDSGTAATGGRYWHIAGNTFAGMGKEAIRLDYASATQTDWHIVANYIRGTGLTTTNTYDAISITNASYNCIEANLLRRSSGGNMARYGICINSGTGNLIIGNDVYQAGLTGDILDSGTATVLESNRDSTGFLGTTPKAHGASLHTDVTRSLWISPGSVTADGGSISNNGAATPDGLVSVALTDGSTQGFYFSFTVPADWASGAINAVIYWVPSATDAVAHTVRWQFNVKELNVGDDTTAASTATSWTGASAARTANLLVTDTSTAILTPSAANRLVRFNIRRLGADGADTYVGNVYVTGIRLDYTASQ